MSISIDKAFPGLSPRQREVCALLVKGYSHKEISHEIGCAKRTVEDHVQEILRRAKVYDTRRLIYQAFGAQEVTA